MADLIFPEHAWDAMRADQITEDGVYQVVGDYDDKIERRDGRTEYTGVWDGRTFTVVIEDDGQTVVTV